MLFVMNHRGKVADLLRECLRESNREQRGDLDEIRSRASERQKIVQNYNEEYFNSRRKEPRVYKVYPANSLQGIRVRIRCLGY